MKKEYLCRNVLLNEMSLSYEGLTRKDSALVWPDSQSTTVVWLEESLSDRIQLSLRYCVNEKSTFMLST